MFERGKKSWIWVFNLILIKTRNIFGVFLKVWKFKRIQVAKHYGNFRIMYFVLKIPRFVPIILENFHCFSLWFCNKSGDFFRGINDFRTIGFQKQKHTFSECLCTSNSLFLVKNNDFCTKKLFKKKWRKIVKQVTLVLRAKNSSKQQLKSYASLWRIQKDNEFSLFRTQESSTFFWLEMRTF